MKRKKSKKFSEDNRKLIDEDFCAKGLGYTIVEFLTFLGFIVLLGASMSVIVWLLSFLPLS